MEGDPTELWVWSADFRFQEDLSPAWTSSVAWNPEADGPAGLHFWLAVASFLAETNPAELVADQLFLAEPAPAEPAFAVDRLPWDWTQQKACAPQ